MYLTTITQCWEYDGLKVRIGDPAPDFTAESGSGQKVSLSDYRGKKSIVLYFYPKDETQGCTREACSFRDSYEAFKELGTEVIGVSSDSADSHKRFSEHHYLPFILLSDPKKELRKLYGVPSNIGFLPGRVTYVIDKEGIVRHIFNSQIHPEKHVEEAISILRHVEPLSH